MEKIIRFICSQVGKTYFVIFCFLLPFIGLIFPSTMVFVGFLSSSFLQLVLLPILSRGQDEHDSKLDSILELLQSKEDKELEELEEIIHELNQ